MKDDISNETLQAIKRVTLGRWGNGNLDKIADHLIDTRAQLAEATKQRDVLVETLKIAMARAYARGYQHGHDDSVESSFINVKEQDAPEYFSEDVTQMLLDGGQPEAAAALAAVKGGNMAVYDNVGRGTLHRRGIHGKALQSDIVGVYCDDCLEEMPDVKIEDLCYE